MKLNPLFLLILLLACSENKTTPSESIDRPVQDTAYFALDLDSAQFYVANYRSNVKKIFKDTIPVDAFTIRTIDLLEAVGASKNTRVTFDHVRVYLGMDNNNKFRLLLTPVVGANLEKGIAGRDTILSGPHTGDFLKNTTSLRSSDGEYVLDFNMPCPNTCDANPLNLNNR